MIPNQFAQFLAAYKLNWIIANDAIESWRCALTSIPFKDAMAALQVIQEKRIKNNKTDKMDGPKMLELKKTIKAIKESNEQPGCVVHAKTEISQAEQAEVDESKRLMDLAGEWLRNHPDVHSTFRDYLRGRSYGKVMVDKFDSSGDDYPVTILASAVAFIEGIKQKKGNVRS